MVGVLRPLFKVPHLAYFLVTTFYWWRKSKYLEKTPISVESSATCTSGVRTHNLSVDWLVITVELLIPLANRGPSDK